MSRATTQPAGGKQPTQKTCLRFAQFVKKQHTMYTWQLINNSITRQVPSKCNTILQTNLCNIFCQILSCTSAQTQPDLHLDINPWGGSRSPGEGAVTRLRLVFRWRFLPISGWLKGQRRPIRPWCCTSFLKVALQVYRVSTRQRAGAPGLVQFLASKPFHITYHIHTAGCVQPFMTREIIDCEN